MPADGAVSPTDERPPADVKEARMRMPLWQVSARAQVAPGARIEAIDSSPPSDPSPESDLFTGRFREGLECLEFRLFDIKRRRNGNVTACALDLTTHLTFFVKMVSFSLFPSYTVYSSLP